MQIQRIQIYIDQDVDQNFLNWYFIIFSTSLKWANQRQRLIKKFRLVIKKMPQSKVKLNISKESSKEAPVCYLQVFLLLFALNQNPINKLNIFWWYILLSDSQNTNQWLSIYWDSHHIKKNRSVGLIKTWSKY